MLALDVYESDTGRYPSEAEGLLALLIKPPTAVNWQGPYLLSNIPRDPWNRQYIYRLPGMQEPKPEIVSYGADGTPGGSGINADVKSWK